MLISLCTFERNNPLDEGGDSIVEAVVVFVAQTAGYRPAYAATTDTKHDIQCHL
jgi:hypothetical protein